MRDASIIIAACVLSYLLGLSANRPEIVLEIRVAPEVTFTGTIINSRHKPGEVML